MNEKANAAEQREGEVRRLSVDELRWIELKVKQSSIEFNTRSCV